jgi:hypothetical protein
MEKSILIQKENHGKTGWSAQEEALLKAETKLAREECRPIKTVFERVAEKTGRKPNSVRNYYYARLKQEGETPAAFELFTPQEVRAMLKTILQAQARGMSVRACTLKMGGGENKAMLRYQNKYRSVIKNNPALVLDVISEMRRENLPVFDPYEQATRKKARGSLEDMVLKFAKNLQNTGMDVNTLLSSLCRLSEIAASSQQLRAGLFEKERQSAELEKQLDALHTRLYHIEAEYARLSQSLHESENRQSLQDSLLSSNRESLTRLLGLFRQLLALNKEFLQAPSAKRSKALSNYTASLSRHTEDCERVLNTINL